MKWKEERLHVKGCASCRMRRLIQRAQAIKNYRKGTSETSNGPCMKSSLSFDTNYVGRILPVRFVSYARNERITRATALTEASISIGRLARAGGGSVPR